MSSSFRFPGDKHTVLISMILKLDEDADEIERYDEDEDDYTTEDDHFENISEEDNVSYLEDEVKELENEAIFHNPQV